jgi:hypothetical protein
MYSSTSHIAPPRRLPTLSRSSSLVDVPLSSSESHHSDKIDVVGSGHSGHPVAPNAQGGALTRSSSEGDLVRHRTSNLNEIFAPLVSYAARNGGARRAQDSAARARLDRHLQETLTAFQSEHPNLKPAQLAKVQLAYSKLNNSLLHAALEVGMQAQSGALSAVVVGLDPTSLRITRQGGVALKTLTKTASSDDVKYTPEHLLKLRRTDMIDTPGLLYIPGAGDGRSGYARIPETAAGISLGGTEIPLSTFEDPFLKPTNPRRSSDPKTSTSP